MPEIPDPAERRGEVADQEGVDPDDARRARRGRPGRRGPASPCRRSPRGRTRSSWPARSPRPRRRTSGRSAPGRTPRAARSRRRCRAARSASARRPARRRPAAAQDLVALGARPVDEALDARQVVGVDHRRDRGCGRRAGRRARARRRPHGSAPGTRRRRDSCTSRRVPARHTWPASSYCPAALRAAASRSASANTISGPLPPSSAVNGTRLRGRGDADVPRRLR